MKASWKRLVIVVFYAFSIWLFLYTFNYWKHRRRSLPITDVNIFPERVSQRYTGPKTLFRDSKEPLDVVVWRNGAHISDGTWKRWAAGIEAEKSVLNGGRFIGFQGQFARLNRAVIDGSMVHGSVGGEEISSVLNQPENKEFLEFKPGLFQLLCDEPPQYGFKLGHRNHINNYMKALTCSKTAPQGLSELAPNKTVFVVTRYEYVNIYHSMTDFYNAFLNMAFLGLKPDEITVLLADAHPRGGLDSVWSTLFHSYRRLGELRGQKLLVKDMVWVQLSYLSPLITHKLHAIPATEEFRRFFLHRYGTLDVDRALNCSQLRVTFIWRRDYLAHPRNPSGHVVRKIKNEADLVSEVRHEIPNALVHGSQVDLMPMDKQLQLIADTDVLIGMHGAGLTHAMFLPQHAGLVELYPTYWSEGNVHFKKIAQWRHLHYQRWVNHNPRLELANHYTRIPQGVVSSMVRQILHGMRCTIHEH